MPSGISEVALTSGISEVVVTADDPVWLVGFIRILVNERLCACAQHITAIRSIYRWEGDVQDATEARVALHTRNELVPPLIERIERDHPYEMPCVLAVSIDAASPAYVEWVRTESGSIE